tara:strand:+ start:1348 stop:2238 length:891 start_codon:yes stop_codon:yes gene_type:complete
MEIFIFGKYINKKFDDVIKINPNYFNKLKYIKVKKKNIENKKEALEYYLKKEQETCCICFNNYINNKCNQIYINKKLKKLKNINSKYLNLKKKLPCCNNEIHYICFIQLLLSDNLKCPLCRKEFDNNICKNNTELENKLNNILIVNYNIFNKLLEKRIIEHLINFPNYENFTNNLDTQLRSLQSGLSIQTSNLSNMLYSNILYMDILFLRNYYINILKMINSEKYLTLIMNNVKSLILNNILDNYVNYDCVYYYNDTYYNDRNLLLKICIVISSNFFKYNYREPVDYLVFGNIEEE